MTYEEFLESHGVRGAHSYEVTECACGDKDCGIFYVLLCDEKGSHFAHLTMQLDQAADLYGHMKGAMMTRGVKVDS